jgi:hypothetical protein
MMPIIRKDSSMLTITTDRYTLVSSLLADVAAQVPALQAANPATALGKHPLIVAAALFAVRAGTLIQDDATCLGAVSITARPRPLTGDHPVITALASLVERHGSATAFDDDWCRILSALEDDALFGWASPEMVYNALVLLLTGAVVQESETTFCVTGSKPYYPKLVDAAGDIQQGFTCTCKWFYSSQGLSGPCKHVVASALHAFAALMPV